MDNLDIKILSRLLNNCRESDRQIGKELGISGGSVRARIRKMENSQVIENFTIKVDPPVLGLGVLYIVVSGQNIKEILEQISLVGKPFFVVPCVGGVTVCGIVVKEDIHEKIKLANELMKDVRILSIFEAESPGFDSNLTKTDLEILNELTNTIEQPANSVKPHAPKMVKVVIDGDYIGAVIGPGGKVIQEMQKETGTTIVIEEEDEKGIIEILGTDQEMIDTVIQKIDDITFKPEYGKEYDVKVVKILEFGAVVEFRPGKEVLLHVSEIAWERVEKVEKYLNLGDITRVKYMGIDSRTKKQKVSRKILLERPKKKE